MRKHFFGVHLRVCVCGGVCGGVCVCVCVSVFTVKNCSLKKLSVAHFVSVQLLRRAKFQYFVSVQFGAKG